MNIKNNKGLSIGILDHGLVSQITAAGIRISLKPANVCSRWGANVYLRKRSGKVEYTPLTGPGTKAKFRAGEGCYESAGSWNGVNYIVRLILAENDYRWAWQVDLLKVAGHQEEYDLVLVQDVGMKNDSPGLVNEYYVSQYLERIILQDPQYGAVICCRQNMRETTGHPWLMIGCRNGALSGSTDGMQLFGRTYRETGLAEGLLKETLGGNYAGESPYVALQEKPFQLRQGESHRSLFVCQWKPDHPGATSDEDLKELPILVKEFSGSQHVKEMGSWQSPGSNLFAGAEFLPVEDLTGSEIESYFCSKIRHAELVDGQLLSFFHGSHRHVMLKAKELLTDRPHGHIMHTGQGLYPDENTMSTTAYACGVFNSHISQGNTNFSVLLSVCTTPFNTSVESGQRMFIETDGRYYLLGIPSAFEMGLNHCRWIYKSGGRIIEVKTRTSVNSPEIITEFSILRGNPVHLLVTNDFDPLNRWKVDPGKNQLEYLAEPAPDSMLAGKFPEARFRIRIDSENAQVSGFHGLIPTMDGTPLFVVESRDTRKFGMTLIGEVVKPFETGVPEDRDPWNAAMADSDELWRRLSLNLEVKTGNADLKAISEILPWFAMNALTHYQTPYGLEQFSGAAWGTRDVSQGPVDLLLTLGYHSEVRKILQIIFSNQNPDGGWPQWWMFDSFPEIRAHDSHGDVVYWVMIALANYVRISGDLSILDEKLPYFGESGVSPVSEHISRLVSMVEHSFILGTCLVPFGGGDWNDSLQPVSSDLASRMVSSWTVEMNYQAFMQLANMFDKAGNQTESSRLQGICKKIRTDFNSHLTGDGIVAGYGLHEAYGTFSLMLHPSDQRTGVSYSLLPMERGILSNLFTPDQASHHQHLIEAHLKGPDGARLMDLPLRYKGGIQSIFQRAESSTFFGREIGLMYIHEHIRYAESLAITGKPEAFAKALRQAVPVGYQRIVPCGDIRQANCYYSSSDVVFETRYEADHRYADVLNGKFTLRGGWRVYSSGPGIFISLFITRLLGIRLESDRLILDPVMTPAMDGSVVSINLLGSEVTIHYQVTRKGFGVDHIRINDQDIDFKREDNPYRKGGAIIPMEVLQPLLSGGNGKIDISL